MAYLISLGGVLFGLWVLLSGHFEPLLLFLGVVSTAVSVYIAWRMDVVDHEGVPVLHLNMRFFTYLPWLVWEVWLCNVAVARVVLRPKLRISPTLIRFKAAQRTELGRVIMANSVTMTPGTITVAVTGDELHVHALYREASDGMEEGEMNRRVAEMERLP